MSSLKTDTPGSESSFRFFAHFFRAYPRRSASMVGLLVLAGFAEGVGVVTLVPLLELAPANAEASSSIARAIVGALAFLGLRPTLIVLLGTIVVAMSVKAVLLWLAMTQVGYTVARVTRDLRQRLMRGLLHARWRYFRGQALGSFANTISSEALRSAWAYREACTLFAGLVQVAIYVTLSAIISWQVTVFAIVAGGLLAAMLDRFVKMSRAAGGDQTRLTRSLTGRLVDVLQGVKAIKAMAREELVLPLLEQENEGLNQAQRRQVVAAEARKLFQEPTLTVLLAIALYINLALAEAPLSSVLVLAFVFYRLMQQINQIQTRFQSMAVGESAYWSILGQIEEAEAEQEQIEIGTSPGPLKEGIRLESVTFSYEPGKPVLQNLSLEIPVGEFVAITGESGSGKTTLADLVVGLQMPDGGRILVDGTPLSELSLLEWRRRIGYVPQELLLFNDTIARNVTLGDDTVPPSEVERALRLAGAWDFVSARPAGMDAEAGEKGGLFSGGQRQRIAIARALVHRPSLLVLDEVTTALDPDTEREICNTLKDLSGEVTILSISHQPAMREAADIVYSLRNGVLTGGSVRGAPASPGD